MIDFAIISALILLASTKILLQSRFSKRVGGAFGNVATGGVMWALFFTPFRINNGVEIEPLGMAFDEISESNEKGNTRL